MVEVIEVSLEETNKLRAKLGLPLITPKKPDPNEERRDLSLEETNKLRAKIGLKPIPSAQPSQTEAAPLSPSPQTESSEQIDYEAVQSRVLKARQTSIKRKLELDFENDDDWLANLGKPVVKKGKIKLRDIPHDDDLVVVHHSAQELALMGERTVLTMGNSDLVDSDEEVGLHNEQLTQHNHATSTKQKNDSVTTVTASGVNAVVDNTEALPSAQKAYTLAELLEDDATPAVNKDIKLSKIKRRKKHKSDNVKVTRLDDDIKFAAPVLSTTADFHDTCDEEFEAALAKSRRVKQKPVDLKLKIEEHRAWDASAEADTAIATITFDDSRFLSDLNSHELTEQPTSNGNSVKPINEEAETDMTSSATSDETTQAQGTFHSVGSIMSHLRAQKSIEEISEERQASARRMRSAQQHAHKLRLEVDIEKRMLREELAKDKLYMAMSNEAKEEHYEKMLAMRLHQKQLIAPKTLLLTDTRAYNPVVKIRHLDDRGNELLTKQAYKHQARIFHGTGTRKRAPPKN